MERIGDEIRRAAGMPGGAGDARLTRIVAGWQQAVGEQVARHAWPSRLAGDGTLHIATSSSVWAFELTGLASVMLERLQESLGEDAPAAVRFAVGRVPDRSEDATPEPPRVVAEDPAASVEAASLVAAIEDDELRELARRAAAASLRRARHDRPL